MGWGRNRQIESVDKLNSSGWMGGQVDRADCLVDNGLGRCGFKSQFILSG